MCRGSKLVTLNIQTNAPAGPRPAVFQVIARFRSIRTIEPDSEEFATDRQLKVFYQGRRCFASGGAIWLGRAVGSGAQLWLFDAPQEPPKSLGIHVLEMACGGLEQLTAALMRYPHHIEGEQYIAINMLAAQGKVYGMVCYVPHSGHLNLQDATFLRFTALPFPGGWLNARRYNEDSENDFFD
jgi:hypothetical protein